MITAPTFDLRPDSADGRPSRVSNAVSLLVASQALGLVTSVLLKSHILENALVISVQVLTELFLFWLIYRIWIGSRWARTTFALLFTFGIPSYIPMLVKFFQISTVAGSINLSQCLLQLAAICLLFSEPARGWFKRKSTRGPIAQTVVT